MKKVAIIGGGFSGLSMAWAICKTIPDTEVNVYEQGPGLGGLLHTKKKDLGMIETAANAILLSPSVEEMGEDFGIHWAIKKKSGYKKWVMLEPYSPKRWPLTWGQTFKNLDVFLGLSMGLKRHQPLQGETVSQWCKRVFRSPEIEKNLIGPALQGVYAARPEQLSASLCLASLFSKKLKHKGSYAPANGMAEFFIKGKKYLEAKNVKFNFYSQIKDAKEIQDADWVIDCRPNGCNLKLNYLGVASVNIFWDYRKRPSFEGFGCLFPNEKKFLGVVFESDIFDRRTVAEDVFLERWIVRIEKYKELDSLKDDLLHFRELNLPTKGAHFNYRDIAIDFYTDAIPFYSPKLESELLELANVKYKNSKIFYNSENKNIIYHGNYLGEIGLNRILQKSILISEYIKQKEDK